MRIDWLDIAFPPAGALVWLLLSWFATIGINAGRPLSTVQRGMLKYGFFFALGMCCLIVLVFGLGWPHPLVFVLIAAWGVLIFYLGWRRSHREQRGVLSAAPKTKVPYLGAGLPTVTLLVCLIGSMVEWGLVVEGSGRLWAAFLWSAGAAASIWLARAHRRPVAITSLRAFIVLAVIGAIAERSLVAVIVAAVAGVILLTLQKLWKPPAPPTLDLEALSRGSQADLDNSHAGLKRR